MRSYVRAGATPLSSPLLADDILELHAARLLLLIAHSKNGRIDGLTKLAKLDFFVRYPQFFDEASAQLKSSAVSVIGSVESSMVRFRYGPWDHRYYQVLPYLEARGLVSVTEGEKAISFSVTERGKEAAALLARQHTFTELVAQIEQVVDALGSKSGSSLKSLIYQTFKQEVAAKPLGEVI